MNNELLERIKEKRLPYVVANHKGDIIRAGIGRATLENFASLCEEWQVMSTSEYEKEYHK
jgi:hypothetical protein